MSDRIAHPAFEIKKVSGRCKKNGSGKKVRKENVCDDDEKVERTTKWKINL